MRVLARLATCSLAPVVVAATAVAQPAAEPADGRFAGNACIECHRDLPGRSSEIVELEWKASMHAAAGVTCDGCHGGNPAVRREDTASDEAWKRASHVQRDPEFAFLHRPQGLFVSAARGRSVSYFCGKCHADIKEKHLGSPHGEFGDPSCLYCHGRGSHLIEDPTLDIIDTRSRAEGGRCSPCHLASTMETVARIKAQLVETEEEIRAAGALTDELESWGYRSLELERLNFQAQEVRSALRQVFHSFNMLEITNFAGSIGETVDRTKVTHEMIGRLREAQRRQARDGALVTVMLLVLAGLLVFYRHAFLHPEQNRVG